MAEILIAREAGACYGVERALDMVRDAAKSADGAIYTLGPLIHNPAVVAELEAAGVRAIDDPAQAEPGSTLVLRTHGVTPKIEDEARAAGVVVLDATCPFVKRVHRAVERLAREGYQVLVMGEAGHPEVEGTIGHAEGARTVGTADEARCIELGNKVGVVVQTTQSRESLRAVVSALIGRTTELRLIDTICEATSGHQAACAELAQHVDVMVVVGGKTSANTTHLAEIARDHCPKTHHIEAPDELESSWFEGATRIGITAGASTPASQIEAVRDAIRAMVEGD